jgi:5-methylcytosine-specific restriction endonuclease McrA
VFFAKKRNKPEKYKNYRTICFKNHKKICVVCGEDKIVTVHHMDEDHQNNDPKNLVPLCPTHHHYWHSKYRELIRTKVEEYINNF